MYISDVLRKRLIEDMATISILQYIKNNEDNPRTMSKDRVAREMHEKNICSRSTTLKIIDSLIQAEIVKDREDGRRNVNNLIINETFQFEEIMQQSFDNYIKEVAEEAEPFAILIKKGIINQKGKKDSKGIWVPLNS